MSDTVEVDEWIQTFRSSDGSTVVNDLGGVSWHEAPVPNRWHRCRPQTKGFVGYLTSVFRCACGAISPDGRRWTERNSRIREGVRRSQG